MLLVSISSFLSPPFPSCTPLKLSLVLSLQLQNPTDSHQKESTLFTLLLDILCYLDICGTLFFGSPPTHPSELS